MPKHDYGASLPVIYGKARMEGNKYFPDTLEKMYTKETITETTSSGSGGKGGNQAQQTSTTTTTVYGTWAVVFALGECTLERLILNGNHITESHPFYQKYCTFFDGTQTTTWSEIVAIEGAGSTLAQIGYLGLVGMGFKDVPLSDFGNQLPQQVSAVLVDNRFGATPQLGIVVEDICKRAGIDASLLDVTELNSQIINHGFFITNSGESYRDVLQQLMTFFLFTAIETSDGKIKFKFFDRGAEAPLALQPGDMLPVEGTKLFTKTTQPAQSLPNALHYRFINENTTFESDVCPVHLGDDTKENAIELNSNLILDQYKAREKCYPILRHIYLQQRHEFSLRLPVKMLESLELLRVLLLPNGEQIQIHQIQVGNDGTLKITAKFYGGSLAYSYTSSTTLDPRVVNNLRDRTTDIPDIYIIDCPIIEEGDPPSTLYGFATGSCVIDLSNDGGSSFNTAVNHIKASTIGALVSSLPSVTTETVDVTNTVDVQMETGELNAITDVQLQSGYNRAIIATEVNGVWVGEILSFRDVTALGNNTYRLSTFYRGLLGTFYLSGHNVGAKLFLFKGDGAYYSKIKGSVESIGNSNLAYRPRVADYQDLGSTPVTTFTPQGNAYVPPPSTNLDGEIDVEGNIRYSWDYDNAFSPYKNGQENVTFEVDIMSGASVVRTLTSANTSVTYFSSVRATDGLGTTLTIRVYAVSSIVGRGIMAEANITPALNTNEIFGEADSTIIAGIKYIDISDNPYAVLPGDENYALISVNNTATIHDFIFPPGLRGGFNAFVINPETNDAAATIEITPPNSLVNTTIVAVGQAYRVIHLNNDNYITIGGGGSVEVKVDDDLKPRQPALNFISGKSITIQHTDDAANAESELQFDVTPFTTRLISSSYTLNPDDEGVVLTTGSNITVTLTASETGANGKIFETGWQCVVIARENGYVTFQAGTGTNLLTPGFVLNGTGRAVWIGYLGGQLFSLVGYLR
jgi:hypothetical protein